MPEELLDIPHICPAAQQMNGEGLPEQVGMKGPRPAPLLEPAVDARPLPPPAVLGQEQLAAVGAPATGPPQDQVRSWALSARSTAWSGMA